MVLLLKEQLHQHRIVSTTSTTLPQSSETVGSDTGTSLPPASADKQDTSVDHEPAVLSEVDHSLSTASSPDQAAGTRVGVARPPLLHSASLPSHYDPSTSLSDSSPTSSLATALMDRMSSLETRVAEQQRKSEADIARLLNQVRLQRRVTELVLSRGQIIHILPSLRAGCISVTQMLTANVMFC